MSRVSVFGGGAWGRALAFALAEKNEVYIVSRRDITSLLAPLNEKIIANNHTPIQQVAHHQALKNSSFATENKNSLCKQGYRIWQWSFCK